MFSRTPDKPIVEYTLARMNDILTGRVQWSTIYRLFYFVRRAGANLTYKFEQCAICPIAEQLEWDIDEMIVDGVLSYSKDRGIRSASVYMPGVSESTVPGGTLEAVSKVIKVAGLPVEKGLVVMATLGYSHRWEAASSYPNPLNRFSVMDRFFTLRHDIDRDYAEKMLDTMQENELL